MKIKRFFSQDMRSAIRMVREELGADAVILSNDRVNGGVEIVAAVDYDETILERPVTSRQGGHKEDFQNTDKNKSQQNPSTNPAARPSNEMPAAAQKNRYDVRQEAKKEVASGAREENGARYDDFERMTADDRRATLDADDITERLNSGVRGKGNMNTDKNNFSNTVPNDGYAGNFDNNYNGYQDINYDEEFDADYCDDTFGNQHISTGLQSKIDSAFNPVGSRRESPYLYGTDSGNSNEKNTSSSAQLSSKPSRREQGQRSGDTDSLAPSAKSAASAQSKSFDKSYSKSPENSQFLSLDDIPAGEVKVNDTLFDTSQVRDFPRELVNNQKHDPKNSYSVWSQEPTLVAMREEITTLRGMLEQQLNGLAWNDLKKNNPLRAKLIKQLLELGFSPDLADQVIKAAEGQTDYRRAWQITLSALAEKLPIKDDDMVLSGGVVALVGATGVGKTTTIAKLAARYALRHGRNSIVMITTDTYRIGALEQLRTYGRILGIPVKIAHNKKQLKDLLKLLGDKKFVLIDTAGMGQRDIRLMEQFSVISDCAKGLKTLLVLSSTTHRAALDETVRTFSNVEINSCILSKLDETTNLGGALSVVAEYQLPVAYISDGQRVPEDLHLARSHTLINRCVSIARRANQALDNDSLELAYSRMPSHVSA